MKKSEAIRVLTNMMLTLQRFRSITEEGFVSNSPANPAITKKLLEDLQPWIFGEKCPLKALSDSVSRYDDTGSVDPLFVYNMVLVATTLEPSIYVACAILGYHIPEKPCLNWMRGFEEG